MSEGIKFEEDASSSVMCRRPVNLVIWILEGSNVLDAVSKPILFIRSVTEHVACLG